MGQVSVVYGVILGLEWKIADRGYLQRLNQTAIEQLPKTDDWPFLTRSLFSIAGDTPETGHYRRQCIHFGASFKGLEWEWDRWLVKFESLLSQLFWDEVLLHLYTEAVGHYDYQYKAIYPLSFYNEMRPIPSQEWQFAGGPRVFDEEAKWVEECEQTWQYLYGQWQLASLD